MSVPSYQTKSSDRRAELSLRRIMPRLEARYAGQAAPSDWSAFAARLETHFADFFQRLLHLYGSQYDFFYHLENILAMAARSWLERPSELKALDAERELHPDWFQSERMLGAMCYADLFAKNLEGIRRSIPYFKELGLTYLHLMPLFRSPAGNSDGGYAVSSYREVDPRLGTMDELRDLATDLRHNGISLVLDFVFNHTSDEHEWASRALAGDPDFQEYYYLFPDYTIPQEYQQHLRDIFPDVRPGSFTYRPDVDRWVWTTFNSFQWDLNYSNPTVFTRMAEEMLFLANQGAEILRLDALAFIWKQMGTPSESLPEAHILVQAFNTLARIAAPSLLFKSEAIVHPDEVARYIAPNECQLSYNPLLMALLWEGLATRDVRLLQLSMREHFAINPHCAWVNYVRSHDDIGWTFDDAEAARLGINGYNHRRFLNAFYTGRFDGSFARGLPFQENPRTGDARISGTCASLAGLESAIRNGSEEEIELGIRRILLLHSVILSIGGIPLIYLGDETGTLNDYAYRRDPAKAGDSRWVHRPPRDGDAAERRTDPDSIEGRIFSGLTHLIRRRKDCPALADGETEIVDSENPHVFAYVRHHDGGRALVFASFSEGEQRVSANQVRIHGLDYTFRDLISGEPRDVRDDLVLSAYQIVWLVPV